MLRTLGTLTVACIFAGSLVACDLGEVPREGDDTQGTPDAGPILGGPDADPLLPACKNTVLTVGDGHHNPGQDCMQGACHAPGGGGPTYALGGTLYTNRAGGTAQVGATITLIDAAQNVYNLPTQQNGNFYMLATGTVTPPFTVYASECPGLQQMTATATGACNSAGCHALGSVQGAVYLP